MHRNTLGGIMSIRGKGRSTMAKAGDTIESPPTGARIRFLKTARDTNGQLLQIDDVMQGGGRVAIEHVHP